MPKFKNGDIVQYAPRGDMKYNTDTYTVIDDGEGLERFPNYRLTAHEDWFVLISSAVSRVVEAEKEGWQTITQEDADLLNRLGVEFISRVQIKIKEKK